MVCCIRTKLFGSNVIFLDQGVSKLWSKSAVGRVSLCPYVCEAVPLWIGVCLMTCTYSNANYNLEPCSLPLWYWIHDSKAALPALANIRASPFCVSLLFHFKCFFPLDHWRSYSSTSWAYPPVTIGHHATLMFVFEWNAPGCVLSNATPAKTRLGKLLLCTKVPTRTVQSWSSSTVGPLIIESLGAKKRVSIGAVGALDVSPIVQTKIWKSAWGPGDNT